VPQWKPNAGRHRRDQRPRLAIPRPLEPARLQSEAKLSCAARPRRCEPRHVQRPQLQRGADAESEFRELTRGADIDSSAATVQDLVHVEVLAKLRPAPTSATVRLRFAG